MLWKLPGCDTEMLQCIRRSDKPGNTGILAVFRHAEDIWRITVDHDLHTVTKMPGQETTLVICCKEEQGACKIMGDRAVGLIPPDNSVKCAALRWWNPGNTVG